MPRRPLSSLLPPLLPLLLLVLLAPTATAAPTATTDDGSGRPQPPPPLLPASVPPLNTLDLGPLKALVEANGSPREKEEFGMFEQNVALLPPDPAGLTHFGNMGLRATQRHMHARSKDGRPPFATALSPTNNGRQGGDGLATDDAAAADDDDDEATILPALRAAVRLFAHAVNIPPLPPHPGGLYSLGVLWKLYPRLMARVIGVGVGWPGDAGGVSEAYRHLCLSRDAFIAELARRHQKQCAGVSLVGPAGREGGGGFDGQTTLWTGEESMPLLQLPPFLPPPPDTTSTSTSISTQLTYDLRLLSMEGVYIQGPDGAVHDLYRGSPTDPTLRQCHVLDAGAGCYLSLEAQFTFPGQPLYLQEAASLLTAFSGGGFFYHFLLDSLPRLLLLRQSLLAHSPTPHTHNITLILPAPGPAHIKEGLTLLTTALRKQEPQAHDDDDQGGRLGLATAPWPFNPQPVFSNGTAGVLAVGRLWQLDWRPRDDERGLAMRFPHTRLCAPASGLRLLRATLVPTPPRSAERQWIVWLRRDTGSPRSVGNEREVLAALHALAQELGATLKILSGSTQGIAAAVALLPGARVAVGVHGANLANAVFCGEGAALVEIALWEPEFREYEHLAQAIGLRYRPLRGQVRPNAFEDVVWLDPAAVADAVRRAWLEAGEGFGGGGERDNEL